MEIVIDAMGGDFAPAEIVRGAVEGISSCGANVILVGITEKIEAELNKCGNYDKSRISICHTSEVIENTESPVMALRKKKDSSIVKSLELVKGQKKRVLITAGSTGAALAGGLLLTGRVKGVDRPALGAVLPGAEGQFMLIDTGANVDCKVKNLLDFALLGSAYMESVLGIENPRVGLINNGAEEKKGCELTKHAYQELKVLKTINFIGNVEPRDIYKNAADVLVCDGFVGNAILKTSEGMGKMLMESMKAEFMSSNIAKLGALFIKKPIKGLKEKFNYSAYGGAPFLGVNSNIIKIHGIAKAETVVGAMHQAEKIIKNDVAQKIEERFECLNMPQ